MKVFSAYTVEAILAGDFLASMLLGKYNGACYIFGGLVGLLMLHLIAKIKELRKEEKK